MAVYYPWFLLSSVCYVMDISKLSSRWLKSKMIVLLINALTIITLVTCNIHSWLRNLHTYENVNYNATKQRDSENTLFATPPIRPYNFSLTLLIKILWEHDLIYSCSFAFCCLNASDRKMHSKSTFYIYQKTSHCSGHRNCFRLHGQQLNSFQWGPPSFL